MIAVKYTVNMNLLPCEFLELEKRGGITVGSR